MPQPAAAPVAPPAGAPPKPAAQAPAGQKPPAAKGPEKPADGDERRPAAQGADPNAGKEKYVVEGKEYWLTPEQAKGYIQKGIAFEPKVSQLDRIQKEVAAYEQAWLWDPGKMLSNLAGRAKIPLPEMLNKVLSSNASDEVKEATGKWYWENVGKLYKMTDQERAIWERDQKLAQYEQTEKAQADQRVAMENAQRYQSFMQQTRTFISEAMKKSGFSNIDTPHALEFAKVAGGLFIAARKSRQTVTPEMAVDAAHKIFNSYLDARDESLDDEAFIKHLGDARVKRVQKFLLKQAQDVEKGTQQQGNGQRMPPQKRNERKTMNMDDFHDYLDEVKKTGAVPAK